MKLKIRRYIFNTDVRSTIGDLLIQDGRRSKIYNWLCFTLEDEIRPDGKKVYGQTAIPAGRYKVKLTWSPKYRKNLPLIYNQEDGSIEANGVHFEGVRFHGGNTEEDSHGCPLVAFNTDGKKIWGSASHKLIRWFEQNKGEHDLIITNEPFTYNGKFTSTNKKG
jgi:hypothetical protein